MSSEPKSMSADRSDVSWEVTITRGDVVAEIVHACGRGMPCPACEIHRLRADLARVRADSEAQIAQLRSVITSPEFAVRVANYLRESGIPILAAVVHSAIVVASADLLDPQPTGAPQEKK